MSNDSLRAAAATVPIHTTMQNIPTLASVKPLPSDCRCILDDQSIVSFLYPSEHQKIMNSRQPKASIKNLDGRLKDGTQLCKSNNSLCFLHKRRQPTGLIHAPRRRQQSLCRNWASVTNMPPTASTTKAMIMANGIAQPLFLFPVSSFRRFWCESRLEYM